MTRALVGGWGRPTFAAAATLDEISRILRLLIRPRPQPVVIDGTAVPEVVAGWPYGNRYRDYVLRERLDDESLLRPFPRLLGGPGLANLCPPQVLVSLHSGPLRALDPFWHHLPGEVAVVHGPGYPPPRWARSLCADGDEVSRIAVTRHAARLLQDGGFVFMTPDAEGHARVTAEFMGIRLSLASGAFALARLTASPIVPLAVRWRGSSIEAITGEPIAPQSESVMAARVLQWFADYFRSDPSQLSALLHRSQRFTYLQPQAQAR